MVSTRPGAQLDQTGHGSWRLEGCHTRVVRESPDGVRDETVTTGEVSRHRRVVDDQTSSPWQDGSAGTHLLFIEQVLGDTTSMCELVDGGARTAIAAEATSQTDTSITYRLTMSPRRAGQYKAVRAAEEVRADGRTPTADLLNGIRSAAQNAATHATVEVTVNSDGYLRRIVLNERFEHPGAGRVETLTFTPTEQPAR